jgi:hypothetical protein
MPRLSGLPNTRCPNICARTSIANKEIANIVANVIADLR